MSRKLVARANLVVFGVLVAFLTIITGLTWDRFSAARVARLWTLHTYDVLGAIRELEISVRDVESGQRGYLLTGNSDFLTRYDAALSRTSVLIGDLQRLTGDNPIEQNNLRALAPAWQRRSQQLAQTIQISRDRGLEAAIQSMTSDVGRETMVAIEQTLSAMVAEENSLLTQRLQQADSRGDWARALVYAATAIAILALVWAARLLNQAYSRSYSAEAEQRKLADRLNA